MTKDLDINQDLLIEGLIDEFYECGTMQVRDWLVGQNTGLSKEQINQLTIKQLKDVFINTSLSLVRESVQMGDFYNDLHTPSSTMEGLIIPRSRTYLLFHILSNTSAKLVYRFRSTADGDHEVFRLCGFLKCTLNKIIGPQSNQHCHSSSNCDIPKSTHFREHKNRRGSREGSCVMAK